MIYLAYMALGSRDSVPVPRIATEEEETHTQKMSHSFMTQLRKQRREQMHKETKTRFST